MKPSIAALANKHNPQPLPIKSIERCVTPGRIGILKHHTVVIEPGDVMMGDIFVPGHRKLVSNSSDGIVRIIGKNVDNYDLHSESWVLFENSGTGWKALYSGDGAVKLKKKRTENDGE